MKIGIDIDGVLTDLEQFHKDYVSKYCFENNIEININNIDYDIANTFNLTKEQEKDFWDKYLEFYSKETEVRSFASEVIKKLREDGHEIYIITARWLTDRDDSIGENMRQIVKNWLVKKEIDYDKLIFSRGSKEEKSEDIINEKIDLMIEDSPKNIIELSKIVPVICYDTGYNKDCIGENIIRCYSWYDIYIKIKNGLDKFTK